MGALPQFKVFHIDKGSTTEHFVARLESECSPYLRIVAIIDGPGGTLRVVCEARD